MEENQVKEHLREGMAAARDGRNEEARLAFQAALSIDANNETALLWLCYLDDDPSQSLKYVTRALRNHVQSPRVYGALQWALKRHAAAHRSPQPDPSTPATSSEPLSATTDKYQFIERVAFLASFVLAATSVGWAFSLSVQGTPVAVAAVEPTSSSASIAASSVHSQPLASADAIATPSPLPPTPTPQPPTVTPSPSPTPIPTATPNPTIPPPASASRIGEARWIDIDLTNQVLTAYNGNTAVRSVVVSTGRPQTPTPVGQFRIYVKYVTDDMVGEDYFLPAVPYVMYFQGGYGIHGTYWHDNFGEQMSHGCVNLPPSEAEWLFNWSEVGTLVNIHF